MKKYVVLMLVLFMLAFHATASAEDKAAVRVSYLGPEGTYTEEAAQFFFPAAEAMEGRESKVIRVSRGFRGFMLL